MKIILTRINRVTSKKTGIDWYIIEFIDHSGQTGKAVFTPEQFDAFGKLEESVLDVNATVEQIGVEAEFDSRGRCVKLEA